MFDRNRKPIKWSWAELGVNVVRPQMIAEPDRVLKWISFPDAESIVVRFYPVLGRAIAVVHGCSEPFHVPLNMIRDASRNSGWDVEIVSNVEFAELIRTARQKFGTVDGIDAELVELLIENGYLGYDDLSVVAPDWLLEQSQLDIETIDRIIEDVETRAEELGDDSIGGDEPPLDGT